MSGDARPRVNAIRIFHHIDEKWKKTTLKDIAVFTDLVPKNKPIQHKFTNFQVGDESFAIDDPVDTKEVIAELMTSKPTKWETTPEILEDLKKKAA